jgi:hypothetical protein
VLARRIIAVSPDKAFGKQLAVALKAAGGAVDSHASLAELGTGDLQAALVVLHFEGELAADIPGALARFTGDTRAIAIIPRSNLTEVVDVMMASDRVIALMTAEHFDARQLAALATRALAGDIFGLEKLLVWGTHVHSRLVGDYQDKSVCIAQISEFAELMGVRRKYREAIEQSIDEMLMNALYDAPVDEQGKQIFAEIPTKSRISLRVEQKVVVQYACDGKQFAVSVRDAFGTLERATVLRYLHKCLHAEQQIDRKAGGAGLGLYLMVNSSTRVLFNVLPGVATEATCVFDLESPKLQLEQIGFFTEKIDAAGRLAAGPSKRLPSGIGHPVERRAPRPSQTTLPRGLVPALAIAIVVILGLVGALAYPRLFGGVKKTAVTFEVPSGATVEIEGQNRGTAQDGKLVVADLEIGRAYPVVVRRDGYSPSQAVVQPRGGDRVALALAPLAATVELESQPEGANVATSDGVTLGTTPLRVTTLHPNNSVTITFEKTGYQPAHAVIVVPDPGKETRFVQTLAVAEALARVHLVSQPPGAQVVHNGQLVAGVVTPTDVLVEAGKLQRFVVTMPRKVPARIAEFTPGRGEDVSRSVTLVDGVIVKIDSNVDGSHVNVARAPHCKDAAPPLECVLAPGSYTIDFVAPPNIKASHKLDVKDADLAVRFDFGTVAVVEGKQLELPNGKTAKKVMLEAGPQTVTVGDDNGTHVVRVVVKPGATVVVR